MPTPAESARATRSPEYARRMSELGYNLIGSTPEEMGGMLKVEIARWTPIVRASGAKAD
jgi:tripartite-type tricarboxylate transporter receptor subunit TctC